MKAKPLCADTVRRNLSTDSVQTFVSLVLDLSDWGRAHLDEIVAGASSLIRLLNEERGLDVQISIELFAGDQQITRWQAPNLEADILLERLASIGDYAPTIQNTTNLHGAIIQGLQRLSTTGNLNETEGVPLQLNTGRFHSGRILLVMKMPMFRASMDTTATEVSVIGLDAPDFDVDELRTLFTTSSSRPANHLNREFKTVAARLLAK